MRRTTIATFAALLCTVLSGCLSPDMAMSHQSHQRPHVTMRNPETGEVVQELTKLQLQTRLFDLCDLWASLIRSTFDPLIDDATDHDIRSSLVEQKLRCIVSGYTIGVTSDPVGGMLDMMVLSRLLKQSWGPGPRVDDYFGTSAPTVSAAFASADAKVWKIAGGMLSASERSELEERIDRWMRESPDIRSVSFARLSDIDSGFDAKLEADVARSQGLMDVLDEAVRSAEEFRLLGERSLWLASRAPMLVRLSTEASLVSAFDVPQVQQALTATEALPHAVDQLSQHVQTAAAEMDRQRAEILISITDAERSIRPMIDQAKDVVALAGSVVKEARLLAAERSSVAESAMTAARDLREAVATVNAMSQRFYPPGTPVSGDGMGHTTADLALAAEKFNSAMSTLQALTKPGEAGAAISDLSKLADAKVAAIAASGNAAVERAFWRGMILLGVAFVLALLFKAISPRLAPR
ncbi:MAG: hypothetical protein ACREJD_00985 [Phycisphaerales bacterium]